jgi:hypothetical protein
MSFIEAGSFLTFDSGIEMQPSELDKEWSLLMVVDHDVPAEYIHFLAAAHCYHGRSALHGRTNGITNCPFHFTIVYTDDSSAPRCHGVCSSDYLRDVKPLPEEENRLAYASDTGSAGIWTDSVTTLQPG